MRLFACARCVRVCILWWVRRETHQYCRKRQLAPDVCDENRMRVDLRSRIFYRLEWEVFSFVHERTRSCIRAREREGERFREGEGQTHISANEMIYCFIINVRLFWAHFRHRCDERVAPTEPQSTQIKCKFVFQLEELISCRSLPFPFSMQSHNGTITHWIASFGVFNDKNASRDYSFQFSLFDSVRFCFAFVCFAMRRAIISIAFGFRKWQIRMAIRSARTVCVVLHARFCLCQILRSDHCY